MRLNGYFYFLIALVPIRKPPETLTDCFLRGCHGGGGSNRNGDGAARATSVSNFHFSFLISILHFVIYFCRRWYHFVRLFSHPR